MSINTGVLSTSLSSIASVSGQSPGFIFDGSYTENPSSQKLDVSPTSWILLSAVYLPVNVEVYIARFNSVVSSTEAGGCCGQTRSELIHFNPDLVMMDLGGHIWRVSNTMRQNLIAIPGVYTCIAMDVTNAQDPVVLPDTTELVVRYNAITPYTFPDVYFAGVR